MEIETKLDDKALFKWTGKPASLTLPLNYDLPRGDTLGLAEWSLAPCTVHEMTLEMLDGGKATLLRSAELPKQPDR